MKKIIIGLVVLIISSGFILYEKYNQNNIEREVNIIAGNISKERIKINAFKEEEIIITENINKEQDNIKVKEYNIWKNQNQLLEDLLK